MKAIILAAGVGRRLGDDQDLPPKCLLPFDGSTLLKRHLEILRHCGIKEVVLGVGYRADLVHAEIDALNAADFTGTIFNPEFEKGSIVTLWSLREHLSYGGPVLLMDADVLYDYRLVERLLGSKHRNCFLLDRDVEPGEEPHKLFVRDGRLVDFHKKIRTHYDYYGESVGFFLLSPAVAQLLAEAVNPYIAAGKTGEMYEEALRDLLIASAPDTFGFEDITGLPWIEIDFPEDVLRAQNEILPQLLKLGPQGTAFGPSPYH